MKFSRDVGRTISINSGDQESNLTNPFELHYLRKYLHVRSSSKFEDT